MLPLHSSDVAIIVGFDPAKANPDVDVPDAPAFLLPPLKSATSCQVAPLKSSVIAEPLGAGGGLPLVHPRAGSGNSLGRPGVRARWCNRACQGASEAWPVGY